MVLKWHMLNNTIFNGVLLGRQSSMLWRHERRHAITESYNQGGGRGVDPDFKIWTCSNDRLRSVDTPDSW